VYNIFGTFLCITNLSLFRKVISPLYSGKEVHENLKQPMFQHIVYLNIGCYNAITRKLPSGVTLCADSEGERAAGF
jgi:hypothetical protein